MYKQLYLILTIIICNSCHNVDEKKVLEAYLLQEKNNYSGKFIIKGKHSHIVYDYWHKFLVAAGSDKLFADFYDLWQKIAKLPQGKSVQDAVYQSFQDFCHAHGIYPQWQIFWQKTTT